MAVTKQCQTARQIGCQTAQHPTWEACQLIRHGVLSTQHKPEGVFDSDYTADYSANPCLGFIWIIQNQTFYMWPQLFTLSDYIDYNTR